MKTSVKVPRGRPSRKKVPLPLTVTLMEGSSTTVTVMGPLAAEATAPADWAVTEPAVAPRTVPRTTTAPEDEAGLSPQAAPARPATTRRKARLRFIRPPSMKPVAWSPRLAPRDMTPVTTRGNASEGPVPGPKAHQLLMLSGEQPP